MRNEARKPKSRMISFRVDEDYLSRLDALAQQTSNSRAEVLRRSGDTPPPLPSRRRAFGRNTSRA